MPVAAESVLFNIEVNGAQAKRELGAIRGSAEQLGGGLGRVGANFNNMNQSVTRSAAAMSQLGGVMGETGGAASKLLGLAGNLGGAFAAGGVLGLGVTAVASGLGLAADKFDLFGTKAEAAAKKAEQHFGELKREIADLDAALQAMATGTTIERIKQQAIVAERELAARAAIEAVGGADRFARLAQYEAQGIEMPRQIKTVYDAAIEATKSFAAENEKLVKIVRNAQFEKYLQETKEVATAVRETLGPAQSVAPASMEEWTPFAQWARAEKGRDSAGAVSLSGGQAGGPMGAAHVAVTGFYDAATAAAELSTARQAAMWNDLGFTIKGTMGELHGEMVMLGQGAFTTLIGTAQTYFNALATGEEHAAELAAAAFLRGTGEQLVGFGTQATFKGAGYLIDSAGLDPRGYAMLGLGAAAITAGIGMGAAGAAVQAGVPSGVSKPAIDPGVNAGRGSSGTRGGSSGPAELHLHYGVAGPHPDETARTIGRMQSRARDRGFIEPAVRRHR